MGIISTLLSGGMLIGKICQGLCGASKNVSVDEETGEQIIVGSVPICGVQFYQKSSLEKRDGADSQMSTYAANTASGYDVSVVFPNDETGNGLSYDIPFLETVDITDDVSAAHAPDKEILVGPCETSDSDAECVDAKRSPVVKLSFNNMKVGGEPVNVGGYSISCDTSGIKVDTSRKLGTLKYFNMASNTGVLLSSQNDIEETANANTHFYKCDMKNFGLNNGDILSGTVNIETESRIVTGECKDDAVRPLNDAELRCFRSLGIIE